MKNSELKNPVIFNTNGTCRLIIYNDSTRKVFECLLDIKSLIKVCGIFWRESNGYAVGYKDSVQVQMANLIYTSESVVDHINNDRMDNRLVNLRAVTPRQNSFNSKPASGKTSEYKGVSWCKCTSKWVVRIKEGDKQRNLGRFNCQILAAKAYNKRASVIFGQHAWLNDV